MLPDLFYYGEENMFLSKLFFYKSIESLPLNLKEKCHFWSEAKILKSFWQKTEV